MRSFRATLIVGGVARPVPVTGVDQTTALSDFDKPPFLQQTLFNDFQSTNSFTLTPELTKDLKAYIAQHKLHKEAPSIADAQFLALKRKALIEAARMENPQAVKVTEGDCVSCHVTTRVLLKAHENTAYPLNQSDRDAIKAVSFVPAASVSGMNKLAKEDLENKLEGNLVLNFGYREKVISISQRTANETAEIIALVSSMAKK